MKPPLLRFMRGIASTFGKASTKPSSGDGAHESPTARVVGPLMADLRHALRQGPGLTVGVIQDGAPELWTLLTTALSAEPLVTTYSVAIGRYQLNERLADVLRRVEPDVAARGDRLSHWNARLDRDDSAIDQIRAAVRDFYAGAITRNDLTLFHTLDPHLTYLENNGHLMRYARLRKVGLPVGSGVTEGACKSAIEMRTNGSGQRWRPEGLEAVLTLRAVHRSDRLPRFWANFARAYRKEVTRCAGSEATPRPIQTRWTSRKQGSGNRSIGMSELRHSKD